MMRRAPLRSRSTFTRRPAAVELSLTREARLEARAARALAGARPRRQLNELGLWPAGIPQYPTDEAA